MSGALLETYLELNWSMLLYLPNSTITSHYALTAIFISQFQKSMWCIHQPSVTALAEMPFFFLSAFYAIAKRSQDVGFE